jgi:glycosyltransferase involved in cell wall biosynthesis
MRIGIFVLAAGRKAGGPETYEVELIRHLARIDRTNEYFVYCTSRDAATVMRSAGDNFTCRVLNRFSRLVGVAISLPSLLKADGIDFFHCTYAPPPWPNRPFLFTMHCVSNFTHPEFYPKTIIIRLNLLQNIGIRRAKSILCVSDFVQTYLRDVVKVTSDRLTRIYNGVAPEFKPIDKDSVQGMLSERLGIDYPYILFVGKLQARKNIVRLIQAYAQFRRETGSEAKLVLAGKKVETSEGIDEAIHELKLENHVIQLGYVPSPTTNSNSLLPYLYNAARMFVFPSLYEGFGIPVIEAMACGTPVITSSVTSLPEVAGGAAEMVDPMSIDEIAAAMARVEQRTGLREGLIQRGFDRAQDFTWERCAKDTLEQYSRFNRS